MLVSEHVAALETAQARIQALEDTLNIERALSDGAHRRAKTARREALEEAAKEIDLTFYRPCDCDGCYCGNMDTAVAVAAYDEAKSNARRIRALMENFNENG